MAKVVEIIDGKKLCTMCKELLPVDIFHKYAKAKSGLASWCKPCSAEYRKGYNLKWNQAEYRKKHYEKNRDRYIANQKAYMYGITVEQYQTMVELQNNRCAICGEHETRMKNGRPMTLAVDHDHKTDEVRGLLCQGCNVGLGAFADNLERLQNAISYLTQARR